MVIGRWENGIGQVLVFWSHSLMATELTVCAVDVKGKRLEGDVPGMVCCPVEHSSIYSMDESLFEQNGRSNFGP
jgi:hypothetical protein